MNQGQFSGMVTEYKYSHTVKGVKIYQGKMSIERQSGFDDIITFMSWKPDIEVGKFYSIHGEIRTFRQEVYPKKKTYIKVKEIKELMEPIYSNELVLSGILTSRHEVRKTPLGRTIIEFVVCTQNEKSITYSNLIAWGPLAFKVQDFTEGCEVKVYGRLQSREYTKDNSVYTINEISCMKIEEV